LVGKVLIEDPGFACQGSKSRYLTLDTEGTGPAPSGIPLGRGILLHLIDLPQFFQPIKDELPATVSVFIYLAFAVFRTSTWPIQQTFGAKGNRAQPTRGFNDTFPAERAILRDKIVRNRFTPKNGVASDVNHSAIGGIDYRMDPLAASKDQKGICLFDLQLMIFHQHLSGYR
jgi:hypothetical protein